MSPKYPEINRYGLTEYHKQELCFPYTDTPAFKFWEAPDFDIHQLPEGHCAIRRWQDGRCGLCGFRDQLVEDHCHDTGLTRGMLCRSCNITEGKSDSPKLAQWRGGVTVAAELGISKKYVNIFGQTPVRGAIEDNEMDQLADMLMDSDDEFEAAIARQNKLADEQEEREKAKRRIASAVMWF